MLDLGLSESIARHHPEVEVEISVLPYAGSAELRHDAGSGQSALLGGAYDLLILSVAGEVDRVSGRGITARQSVDGIADDLEAFVDGCKADGVRVLVANVSTLDPDNPVYTMLGLDEEPFQIKAQRLNLIITNLSQKLGISVIDVDRVIAEAGGAKTLAGRLHYNDAGCGAIRDEISRIIEDYGFLDERPLMDQVGAGGGRT